MLNTDSIRALATLPALAATLLSVPIIAFVAFYVWVTPNTWKDSRRKKLPPGPRGLPFLGNYLDLAKADTFRFQVQKWSRQYGEIWYTKMGSTDYIWLSSPRAVKELMDKRSSIYSSRPPTPLAGDVASAGRRQLFMAYGPAYRVVRKISHSLLNITVTTNYQPIQDLESKQLMYDLLHDPENFYDHNRRYSSSVILTATYGHRMPNWDAPIVKSIYKVINNLQNFATPGMWLVDTFPELVSLPSWMLGSWRAYGRKCFEHDSPIYLQLWRNLTQEVDEGRANPCFAKDFYLSNPEKQGLDELQAAYQTGGLVEAGSETTSAFLNSWILAMIRNPSVFAKAQAEVDRVVGPSRLPDWSDEKDLPYLRAMIKELLRTRPPNKIGIQHCTTEDDWYDGYFIPKGSVVMLDWWSINNDPTHWSSPSEFQPERYLNHPLSAAAYLNAADPNERDHFSYGAGRRVCPGVHLAEKSLFLNIARVLWGFDLSKKTDKDKESGEVVTVEPETGMVPGWMTIPLPFVCEIRCRDKGRREAIERVWGEAKAGLKSDGDVPDGQGYAGRR